MLDLVEHIAEPRRAQYLDAIGLTEFLPRRTVPGAKASPRVIRRAVIGPQVALAPQTRPVVRSEPAVQPLTSAVVPRVDNVIEPTSEPAALAQPERYVLLLVRTGNVVWLEDLAGTKDHGSQLRLIVALARALNVSHDQVVTDLVEWPLRAANRQLDQGTVADFMSSRLAREADGETLRLVAMGERLSSWCGQLENYSVFNTLTATRMLAEPQLKRDAWLDLHGKLNSEPR